MKSNLHDNLILKETKIIKQSFHTMKIDEIFALIGWESLVIPSHIFQIIFVCN